MARRRLADEPTSRLAVWARRCAFFSLVATLLAIVIVRSGLLEIVPALATFGGALVFAVFGIVLALGAFIVIWREGTGGGGYAFTALAIGVLLLAYPAYLGVRAYRLPMINDITTDPLDPPRFDVLARLRPRGTVDYAGLYAAEQQRAAYPDIEPLERVGDRASGLRRRARGHHQAQMARRGRAPAAGRPPRRPDRGGGAHRHHGLPRRRRGARPHRRATARVIDVRSASRYGRHDFGANAARIRSLLEDIERRRSTRAPSQQERLQRQKKPPAKAAQPSRGQPAQAVAARNRGRAVGRDRAARHQVLQMRQHRHAGRLVSRGSRLT